METIEELRRLRGLRGFTMMHRGPPRRQFKVCLIGEGFVGKTSVRRKYLGEGFKRSYLPTLGVDFAHKTMTFDNIPTTLVIWDIAGQSQFQNLRKRYYEGCSGIILVYSVIDRQSFENASKWLVEAHDYSEGLPPLIIAANKIDLRASLSSEETVSSEEGRTFTENIGKKLNTNAIFIETSALTGENIDDAFAGLTEMMLDKAMKRQRPVEQVEMSSPASASETSTQGASQSSQPAEAGAVVTSASTATFQRQADITPTAEIDPVVSLPLDSPHLQEDVIGQEMTKLVNLRADLKRIEDELASVTTEVETSLLNLRNTIHVKRIMYEHLKKQLNDTRKEWADAYEEYQRTEQRKKHEVDTRIREIEHIRKNIENIGRIIRTRVRDLDMKKMSE